MATENYWKAITDIVYLVGTATTIYLLTKSYYLYKKSKERIVNNIIQYNIGENEEWVKK